MATTTNQSVSMEKVESFIQGLIANMEKSPLDYDRECAMAASILRGIKAIAEG
jgi:hypothetical protein